MTPAIKCPPFAHLARAIEIDTMKYPENAAWPYTNSFPSQEECTTYDLRNVLMYPRMYPSIRSWNELYYILYLMIDSALRRNSGLAMRDYTALPVPLVYNCIESDQLHCWLSGLLDIAIHQCICTCV